MWIMHNGWYDDKTDTVDGMKKTIIDGICVRIDNLKKGTFRETSFNEDRGEVKVWDEKGDLYLAYFDDEERVREVIDVRNEYWEKFKYDKKGRLVFAENSKGYTENITWGKNEIKVETSNGMTILWEFNKGLVHYRETVNGEIDTETLMNEEGYIVKEVNTYKVTEFSYDDQNRMISSISRNAKTKSVISESIIEYLDQSEQEPVGYTYDDEGRLNIRMKMSVKKANQLYRKMRGVLKPFKGGVPEYRPPWYSSELRFKNISPGYIQDSVHDIEGNSCGSWGFF